MVDPGCCVLSGVYMESKIGKTCAREIVVRALQQKKGTLFPRLGGTIFPPAHQAPRRTFRFI